jgi:hypothetical protein
MRHVACIVVSIAMLLLHGERVSAQGSHALGPADGRAEQPFTFISAVRELPDGTVLVVDSHEQSLVRVDFDKRRQDAVGRVGGGPGEYRAPRSLFALGSDTTLLVELSGNWHLLRGEQFLRQVPRDSPARRGVLFQQVSGADRRGNVVAWELSAASGRPGPNDSLPLVRTALSSGKKTVLMKLRPLVDENAQASSVQAAGGARAKSYAVSFGGTDLALPNCDGSFVVLRREPFRVEWYDARARLQYKTADAAMGPLTSADRAPLLRWMYQHFAWPPTEAVDSVSGWPSKRPMLITENQPHAISVADGSVLLHPPAHASSGPNHAAIFTRGSASARRLLLPERSHVVGASARHLYVATLGDDYFYTLTRHAWKVEALACS